MPSVESRTFCPGNSFVNNGGGLHALISKRKQAALRRPVPRVPRLNPWPMERSPGQMSCPPVGSRNWPKRNAQARACKTRAGRLMCFPQGRPARYHPEGVGRRGGWTMVFPPVGSETVAAHDCPPFTARSPPLSNFRHRPVRCQLCQGLVNPVKDGDLCVEAGDPHDPVHLAARTG